MASHCHILAIDDDEQMLELLRKVLSAHGCRVSVRTSAVAGLKLLDEDPADVVLSDVRMPGMDGLTLLERVRARAPDTGSVGYSLFSSEGRQADSGLRDQNARIMVSLKMS